jgi:hypothetical protein
VSANRSLRPDQSGLPAIETKSAWDGQSVRDTLSISAGRPRQHYAKPPLSQQANLGIGDADALQPVASGSPHRGLS